MFLGYLKRKTNYQLMIALGVMLMVSSCGYFESDEARIAKAQEYIRQGDSNSAVIMLKKVLQSNPENAHARFLLGKVEFSRYRLDDAIGAFKKAQASHDPDKDLFYYWAKALMHKGDFSALENLFKQEDFKAELATPRGVLLKADYFVLTKNHDAAKQAFDRHFAQTKNAAVYCLSRIKLLSLQGDDAKTVAESQACEKQFDDSEEFDSAYNRYLRALALLNLKDYAAAQDTLKTLIANYADKTDLHVKLQSSLLLTKLYLLNNQPKQAASLADTLLAYVNHPDLYYAKAMAATQERNYALAEQMHLKALSLMSNYKPSLVEMVKIKYMQGNSEQAKYYASKVGDSGGGAFLLESLDQMAALRLYQQGNFAEAIEALTESGADKDIKSKMILALSYAKINDREKLWQTYAEIAKKLGTQTQKDLLKAKLYVELGEFSEAEKIYNKYIAENNPNAVLAAAELYVKTKKYSQAEAMLKKAYGMQKENNDIALLLVRLYEITGEQEKQYAMLRQLIRETGDTKYKLILAKVYYTHSQLQDAQKLSQEIIAADEGNFDAYIVSANVYVKEKDYDSAEKLLNKAAQIRPDNLQLYLFLARIAYLKSDAGAARGYLDKAISQQPDYMPALKAQIELYLQQNQKEEALNYAKTVAKQLSDKNSGHVLLAQTYRKMGDDGNAIKQLQKALDQDGTDVSLAIAIYELAIKVEGGKKAAEQLHAWLVASDKPEYYLAAADTALHAKQYDFAQKLYQDYLSKNESNAVALNNLSWIFLQKNQNQQALIYAQKALALSPNSPEILDSVGWVLVKQQKYKEAEAYLLKAHTQLNKNPSINYHLATLYFEMNNMEKSKHYLELTRDMEFPEKQAAQQLFEKL